MPLRNDDAPPPNLKSENAMKEQKQKEDHTEDRDAARALVVSVASATMRIERDIWKSVIVTSMIP
jgi:hypothetical protein